jgi:hypothetical protein
MDGPEMLGDDGRDVGVYAITQNRQANKLSQREAKKFNVMEWTRRSLMEVETSWKNSRGRRRMVQ